MNRATLSKGYSHKIYPKIKHRRGATRLKSWLDTLAYLGIPSYDGEPESIFEAGEWNNCFIIDACRLDLYNETYPDDNARKRVTLGSSSPDYVRQTYSDGDYSEVVYVTGNPHFGSHKFNGLTGGREAEEVFHDVFHTWKTDWIEGEGRPSTQAIVRDAKTARKLYPDKKIVVHFMKPHHPFSGYDFSGFNHELDGTYLNSVWSHAERGNISWTEVWEAYKDNLVEIMDLVRPLAKEMDGKTVVTSDHGNLCGENGMGHHPGMRDEKPLREVPWVEFE